MTLPPFPYFGGKQTIAEKIAALLPEHSHYVEPFAGGLSVLLAKRPSPMETVNDLDGDLMLFWRVLRDRPADLERACALTPHSRAEHLATYEPEDVDELERARRVWVQLTQGRGGSRVRTGWRFYVTTSGVSTGVPGYLDGYVKRMPAAARRLRNVSLESRPAAEVIEAYGAAPDVLLYVDPPYLGRTRATGSRYLVDMRGDAEHEDLIERLLRARAAVVLSGYASDLYDTALTDWDRHELTAFTGNGTDGRRTEVVWSNRPLRIAEQLDLTEEVVRG